MNSPPITSALRCKLHAVAVDAAQSGWSCLGSHQQLFERDCGLKRRRWGGTAWAVTGSRSFPIAAYVPFTALQNMTGQPAISLPLAWSKAGLPIGVQFVGRFGEEHLLLQLAAQIEKAEPWNRKRPPVYG